MFGIEWTQIGLIGVVALVLIGPKDLPVAIKAIAGMLKKARRMAAEFQGHVDDMVKDTELAELRTQISELRRFDIRREVERTVDTDGALRSAFDVDPMMTARPFTPPDITEDHGPAHAHHDTLVVDAPHEAGVVEIAPRHEEAPAFVPPSAPPADALAQAGPPAFIPPGAAT